MAKNGQATELTDPPPAQKLLPTDTTTFPSAHGSFRKIMVHNSQLRRKSDFCALNRYRESSSSTVLNEKGLLAHPNLCLQRTVSARFALPASLTSPSIASTLANNSSTIMAKRRSSRVINFGLACAVYYFDGRVDDSEWVEEVETAEEEGPTLADGGGRSIRAVTENGYQPYQDRDHGTPIESHGDNLCRTVDQTAGDDECSRSGRMSTNSYVQQARELFLLRYQNEEVPYYCIRPQGNEAVRFMQSLSDRNRSEIKKFLDRNHRPDDGDWSYLWVSQDLKLENYPVFIFSVKMLENFFKNERMRRVKWHHLSVDKISVYRYSLPQITTKFRIRVARFLARHYRCCILCVWLLVILCISIGIICSVMFGSAPGAGQKVNATFVPNGGGPQERIGGFMDDDGPAEQHGGVRIDHRHGTPTSNSIRGFLPN